MRIIIANMQSFLYVCSFVIKMIRGIYSMKRISFINYLHILIVFMIVSGFCMISNGLYSQNGDDPNLDQQPRSMMNKLLVPGTTTQNSSVITINNWDNFNLGVDFAESNITANPFYPAWYFTAYNTNVAHHTDDGLDWASVIPNFGSTMMGNPVVATDSLGNLFYGNMFGTTLVLGLKVVKSTDNGTTWGPGITALMGTDKCWIACDQTNGPNANNVYACMTNNNSGSFSRSTDHGASFTTTFTPNTQSIPGMMVCVGPYNNIQGGSVYVVTNSGSDFATVYTFYRSLDGGLTFTLMSTQQFANYVGTEVNGRNSVSGMRTRPYPMSAADNSYGPHRGRLYLVYASNDPTGNGNNPDIFSRYSDNGGAIWSSALKVNDDSLTQFNSQWHPAIWCDKENGRLYIQWMDTRDTPTHDSAFIYATYSANGGMSFFPNQRISNQKMKIFCESCGGGGTPAYQGDYNGIYSNKKVAMAGWTDFRYGTFMSTTSYFPDFAMAIDHNLDTLYTTHDSLLYNVSFPEVKLYSDTVHVTASVYPVPVSGTLTLSFPAGNNINTFPGSVPVKVMLTGSVPAGDYQAQFLAQGPNGTPVHQRIATIRVLSDNAVYVIANASPDSICAGESSQLRARTASGTGPFSFLWTPSTGINDPTLADPTASPLVTTLYHVNVTDAVFHTAKDSVQVEILPAPDDPGPISGPAEVCNDSIAGYSISAVQGANNYSWMVPADAQILNGQNTTAISVHWENSGGSVSVIAGNSCGDSNPSVLDVTLSSPPVEPAIIYGPDLVCDAATVGFSIDPVQNATSYDWTVPADATILNGQNTDSISVRWGSSDGNISISAENNCGTSAPRIRSVGLETLPGYAGIITGKDTVCSNYETYAYIIPEITGATSYQWSLPNGTTITSGNGTNSIIITISPDAKSGQMHVEGLNTCGSGAESKKNIVVKVCEGIAEDAFVPEMQVYPNPAEGTLNLFLVNGGSSMNLLIVNLQGQKVYSVRLFNHPDQVYSIDVSAFSRGIYFLELLNDKRFIVKKIILQ